MAAFDRALEDDLSTPRALAELWGLIRDPALEPAEVLSRILEMDGVLGLKLDSVIKEADRGEAPGLEGEIEKLIAERAEAKKAKDYAKADAIRAGLKERGIFLEDGPGGTVWRRV